MDPLAILIMIVFIGVKVAGAIVVSDLATSVICCFSFSEFSWRGIGLILKIVSGKELPEKLFQ